MNIGPISTAMPSMPTANAQNVNAAQSSGEANGGNVEFQPNNLNVEDSKEKMPRGAPEPLKQMATSDFLTLHQAHQTESVMDKLEKIFETILALKLLEDTVKNVSESIEESIKGDE